MFQRSATSLQELLELGHVLDFIEDHSRCAGEKRQGGSKDRSQVGVITWFSLFISVKGFISKEIDAIQKLEEKGGSSSAIVLANRETKKKVLFNIPVLLQAPFTQ